MTGDFPFLIQNFLSVYGYMGVGLLFLHEELTDSLSHKHSHKAF